MECLLKLSKGDIELIIATEGYTIAENRLYCMAKAYREGFSHLLFIDDDMVFDEDVLDRLLSHKKEIVGVVYHSRRLEKTTTLVLENGKVLHSDDIPKGMIKCSHVGTGIMLIDLKVVEKIAEPWFYFSTNPNGSTNIGEDAWFCSQARKAGFTIWCDPSIKVGHLGDFLY